MKRFNLGKGEPQGEFYRRPLRKEGSYPLL